MTELERIAKQTVLIQGEILKKIDWHVMLPADGPITLKAINKMIDRMWLKKKNS